MNRTDVQVTLREMWETRPSRPREGRQLAGVAAAIARRYDIDPVLVRVGFVVAAFFGIGGVLYIAGWITLPAGSTDGLDTTRRASPRPLLVIGLAVAVAASLGGLFVGSRNVLLAAAVAAGLLFLLHRSRGHRGVPAVADSGAQPTVPVAASPPAQPPAWDPLGVAPFAWDLPEPGPAPTPPPVRRRRPPVTTVTLALALLAGGVTGLVMLVAGGIGALPVLFGVVLAVLGTGLVVGAFLHTGRGLVPVALLLSALTWAVVAAPLEDWDGDVGEVRANPLTVAAVAPEYAQDLGSIELDLRRLDLAVPAGTTAAPVTSTVRVGMGDVQVWVPPEADLTLRGSVGLGHIGFEDQESAGPGSELTVIDDLGTDGVRSGRPIVLDVQAALGNVEVHRG